MFYSNFQDSPYPWSGLALTEDINRTARVIENGAGQDTTGKRWDWDQVWEALRDPQFYFSFLNTFITCIPNG